MYSVSPDEGSFAAGASPTISGKGGGSMTSNRTPLPSNFEPGPDDVICGRGKKCYNHIGNERFRQRVLTHLEEYSLAKSKLDKSGVLSKVVDEVRQQSPNGGFVKQDEHGAWHEVGDFLAREKTSQSFRDALHERYKSSNLSKKKRRQEEQSKNTSIIPSMPRSEYEISSRLERISTELLGAQGSQGMDAVNRRNYEMLTGKSYDLPATSGRSRYMDMSRRFSDISADFRSLMERPIGESSHMHDPLFGTEINAANAMPSDYGREKITPSAQAYRERERAHAVARQIEPDFARSSHHFPSVPPDVKAFHQSYPEISYYNLLNEEFSGHQPSSMHQSLPNLPLSKHSSDDRKRPAKEIEPIPFEQIHIPGRSSYKSTSSESFTKKFPAATYSSTVEDMPQSSQSAGIPGQRISRDLMECLDKMTYHSIADDNPFEPIPLAPQQETALMLRRSSDISGASTLFSPQHNPLDESERDEFAEG